MADSQMSTGSLVLYKTNPALITSISDKIEISLAKGKPKKVREKDVVFIHPGPAKLADLEISEEPAIEEAIELLEDESANLGDMAELLYGDFTPATALATWKLWHDGLYFEGELEAMRCKSAEAIAEEQAARDSKAREQEEWQAFLDNVEKAQINDADRKRLAEVERVALGAADRSRILKHFGASETTESAHQFLIRCGYWTVEENPWPRRVGAMLEEVDLAVPALPEGERRDLTHLKSWAIDDVGNQDPDDAIALEGDKLWVHVADVAALVRPDSHLDMAARERGANLYLPERVWTMLPPKATEQLGLGLAETSPALSFGFRFDGNAVVDIEVVPSIVKVTRITYGEVDGLLETDDFAPIKAIADAYRQKRIERNAARLDLPEANIKVVDGKVEIRPYGRDGSRELVTDAMLMAGEAAARFAEQNEIAIPYAAQPQPDEIQDPQNMAEMFAYRRQFKPSNVALYPDAHFGLGLECYARSTSPLRRYADLVVHQQLRAFVTGGKVLDGDGVTERIAALDNASRLIRKAERLSNKHWTLIYLKQNPNWQGEATVVSLEERKAVIIAHDLALETKIRLQDGLKLNQVLKIAVREVDVPGQMAYFRVL